MTPEERAEKILEYLKESRAEVFEEGKREWILLMGAEIDQIKRKAIKLAFEEAAKIAEAALSERNRQPEDRFVQGAKTEAAFILAEIRRRAAELAGK